MTLGGCRIVPEQLGWLYGALIWALYLICLYFLCIWYLERTAEVVRLIPGKARDDVKWCNNKLLNNSPHHRLACRLSEMFIRPWIYQEMERSNWIHISLPWPRWARQKEDFVDVILSLNSASRWEAVKCREIDCLFHTSQRANMNCVSLIGCAAARREKMRRQEGKYRLAQQDRNVHSLSISEAAWSKRDCRVNRDIGVIREEAPAGRCWVEEKTNKKMKTRKEKLWKNKESWRGEREGEVVVSVRLPAAIFHSPARNSLAEAKMTSVYVTQRSPSVNVWRRPECALYILFFLLYTLLCVFFFFFFLLLLGYCRCVRSLLISSPLWGVFSS